MNIYQKYQEYLETELKVKEVSNELYGNLKLDIKSQEFKNLRNKRLELIKKSMSLKKEIITYLNGDAVLIGDKVLLENYEGDLITLNLRKES